MTKGAMTDVAAGGVGQGPRHHPTAVVILLKECNSLVSLSTVVVAIFASILDKMEGGGTGSINLGNMTTKTVRVGNT